MKKDIDLGIRADYAIPMNSGARVEENYFIGVRGNQIVVAEPFKARHKARCRKWIDGKDRVILPGFVNAHTHLPMSLFRGLEDDVPLKTWLFDRIFPLEAEFVSADFVKTGTALSALECIRFGTTTVCDMYFYLDASIQVWSKMGLRGIFGQGFMELPIPEDKDLDPDRFVRFRRLKAKYAKSDVVEIALAPHAPYTCADELLRKVAAVAKETNSLIHIHLDEAPHEAPESQKQYGLSPTERLYQLGILSPRTLCAHAAHLSQKDIKCLFSSGAAVVHNPDSNAKLGSGTAPVAEYLRQGVPLALGTDGAASNNDLSMYGTMDLATKLQKLKSHDNTAMTAAQALWAATQGGANAIGWGDRIGSLEVGKRADLQIVDLNFPHMRPVHDVISHLVYSAQGLEVDTVICDGKTLLKDKKFVGVDPAGIYKKSETYRKKMIEFLRKRRTDVV